MSLDTPLKQMLHVLAARGQAWLRAQVLTLPNPLPPCDPAAAQLAWAFRLARACTDLRGSPVPLEGFLCQRLTPDLVQVALSTPMPSSAAFVLAARAMRLPVLDQLQPAPDMDIIDHLALTPSDPTRRHEAEVLLCCPIPEEVLNDHKIDRFARLLLVSCDFGTTRPRFSSARASAEVFANCMRFIDWAARKGRLTPLAQMICCLRLFDPDIEVCAWLGEVISYQRPDGSFPQKTLYGTADQDLTTAMAPTLSAILLFHMLAYAKRKITPKLTLAA